MRGGESSRIIAFKEAGAHLVVVLKTRARDLNLILADLASQSGVTSIAGLATCV